MSLRPSLLTCKEWDKLLVEELSDPERALLIKRAERAAKALKLPKDSVLARTSESKFLRAGQVVGTLAMPNRTVEILPKIDGDDPRAWKALTRMLLVAEGIKISDDELATFASQRYGLLEILIQLFASRLNSSVQRGLPRRYLVREDDLSLLRGKLDITRQFTRHAVRPDRLACRYDELSENTPLNRVLKATVICLFQVARSAVSIRFLRELRVRFNEVGDTQFPFHEPVKLDRTNTTFHELYRFALLFLKENWQSTTYGKDKGFSLLFPMNELFEKFIGQSLKRALGYEYDVSLQNCQHSALMRKNNGGIFWLRPDAVIKTKSNGSVVILDTKWKKLDSEKTALDVKTSDIYQMLAYRQAYNARHLILLYPWYESLNRPDCRLQREWKVSGVQCRFDIATVNVAFDKIDEVHDALRGIVEETLSVQTHHSVAATA